MRFHEVFNRSDLSVQKAQMSATQFSAKHQSSMENAQNDSGLLSNERTVDTLQLIQAGSPRSWILPCVTPASSKQTRSRARAAAGFQLRLGEYDGKFMSAQILRGGSA